ncbi:beta-ketoacyl-[acyl-carrier-protein] synthase family protein [Desulfovibrio litoralis]|uniref:3-oxoacyl-[acyl-carrier-protein] synthase II n=1 Tax=Desulfovibrio litoralis DSM 11393 TaxID=1121455 RepID=A0A1M7STU4_9BACT|nr:beta-ketoacyl-[acyl-carrier-protein] synthase family protein [Desulfovibrio litoralis]SHN61804.1 3-oxoacyl-[acyl-carrier-protein] synthase II [Desulfovibrio litoralis DSM 11393]
MCVKRVVITGSGVVSPFGVGVKQLNDGLRQGKSAIRRISELEQIKGVNTAVAGIVEHFDSSAISRNLRRAMSKAAQFAWLAAQEAIVSAGLELPLNNKSIGLITGTTTTSVENMEQFFCDYLKSHSVEQVTAMLFFRTMGHSVSVNLAHGLGICGRVLSLSAACSTGLQAIGTGYEMIKNGEQKIMLCGGAEEYHPLTSATFSIMNAASEKYNTSPEKTPRPFDLNRDGIVCAEGAGIVILEDLESAQKRNAPILAEIVGFATNTDSENLASSSPESIIDCMRSALENARLSVKDISYLNAHATGTLQGDSAEFEAINHLFYDTDLFVSSLKGHLGHTMAASGAIEISACLDMLERQCLIATKNLDHPEKSCQTTKVRLLQQNTPQKVSYIMKNSFALGGINCCLIIKEYHD